MLILNTIQFHSPFKTGYDFWAPYFGRNHLLFRLRYIPTNAATLWKELTLQPRGYYTANIFGTGTSFVPAFVGFGLHRAVLYSPQLVRWLRFSGRVELFCCIVMLSDSVETGAFICRF